MIMKKHRPTALSLAHIAMLALPAVAFGQSPVIGAFAQASDKKVAQDGPNETLSARVVEVAQVASAPPAAPMTFSGIVRAERRAHLAFTLGGRMVQRRAEVGQAVKKGVVLAELDLAPLRNARAVAKARYDDVSARLKQLQSDLGREKRLVKEGAGRRETVEKLSSGVAGAQAGRAQAKAGLDEAQRKLDEARLRAPFAGTVIQVMLEPGEFARPGVPIVVLSAEDRLEVEVQVPEAVRAALKRDAPVEVRLPLAGAHTLKGRVTQLGRGASGPGQLFPVVVSIPGSDKVAPGYTAELVFEVKTADAAMVPVAAVADPGGGSPFVFKVNKTTAEKVAVQVLSLVGDKVTVRSPLAVGDEVIVKGHLSLLPGEKIEVRR
ncbi:MAG: efflux RND transporter periplasmic adaptor subunit [Myxococcota bacterium]